MFSLLIQLCRKVIPFRLEANDESKAYIFMEHDIYRVTHYFGLLLVLPQQSFCVQRENSKRICRREVDW